MKNEIEHIIFDLGGVLLNVDLGRIETGFSQIMHSDEDSIRKLRNVTIPDYETGSITTDEFLNSLKPNLKAGYCKEDIIKVWNSIILDLPIERLKMLEELRKNYYVHLLSNINDLHANCFEENFQAWFAEDPRIYFDQFFYSHQIGLRKPEASTYNWVMSQLKSKPEKTLFIDDLPENIEGARSIGIKAYLLMNQKKDIIHLIKELGLLAEW